jgi:hypothetical protein
MSARGRGRPRKKTRRSGINRSNVQTGIRAENRVLNAIPKEYYPERITKDKMSPDGGIPDIKYRKNGKDHYVEVKSVGKIILDQDGGVVHGRAQFLRKELIDLVTKDGIVIFEVRDRRKQWEGQGNLKGVVDSGEVTYHKASAKDVYDLVKDESGNELKVEYSEIISFKEITLAEVV